MPSSPPTFPYPPHQACEDPKITVDKVSEEHMKIFSTFGDVNHNKNGTHVYRGIQDNRDWKHFWKLRTVIPIQRHDLLMGVV